VISFLPLPDVFRVNSARAVTRIACTTMEERRLFCTR